MAAASTSSSLPRVLVIGGTQFMGRATVGRLLASGRYDVTLLNRGRTESPFEGQARHVVCDRRKAALAAFIASEPAWHAVVDFVAFGPDDVRRIIPEHAAKLGLYVLVSTDSVYMACSPDGFERGPSGRLLESSDARPDAARAALDEYGANKLELEAAIGRADALRSVCLRLPDVLGRHENTGRQHKLLKRLLAGKPIGTAVEAGGDGAFGRAVPLSWAFADDVAAAVAAALDAATGAALVGARLHVCSDETPTWAELVAALADELRAQGVPVPPVQFDEGRDTRFVSVDCGALDNGAAARRLPGYVPAPLAQRLRETVAWWLEEQRMNFELAAEEAAEAHGGAVKRSRSATAEAEFRFNFGGEET